MYTYKHPRPVITTDILLFCKLENQFDDLKVLMIRRGENPWKGCLAFPGGHFDPEKDNDVIDAGYRELWEETGVRDADLKLGGIFGKKDRDPRGRYVTIAYWDIKPESFFNAQDIKAGDDAAAIEWFHMTSTKPPKLPEMAADHAEILKNIFTLAQKEKR